LGEPLEAALELHVPVLSEARGLAQWDASELIVVPS